MSVTIEAYKVEFENEGCTTCGRGKLWVTVGPDGVRGSTSYGDETEAEHEADILNAAYNAGRASGIYDASPIQQCTRAEGHDGPCNGLPKKTCKYWRSE
jgi:hypothetical protein